MYVIAYLLKGNLPWQGIIIQPGQIHEDEVLKVKQMTIVKALCKGLPQHFVEYIQCLGFQGKPNYKYLHSILEEHVLPEALPNPQTNASPIRCSQTVICS